MRTYYIIFDKNGETFFLIAKNEDWCLFSSESDTAPVSTPVFEERKKITYDDALVLVFESNMNLPVKISSDYKSYLWATKQSVLSKLKGKDLEIFKFVLNNFN